MNWGWLGSRGVGQDVTGKGLRNWVFDLHFSFPPSSFHHCSPPRLPFLLIPFHLPSFILSIPYLFPFHPLPPSSLYPPTTPLPSASSIIFHLFSVLLPSLPFHFLFHPLPPITSLYPTPLSPSLPPHSIYFSIHFLHPIHPFSSPSTPPHYLSPPTWSERASKWRKRLTGLTKLVCSLTEEVCRLTLRSRRGKCPWTFLPSVPANGSMLSLFRSFGRRI